MGLLRWLSWGRGGDSMYLSYERSFERIADKNNAILARRFNRRKKTETYSRALWQAFCASVVASVAHLVWLNRLPAGALPMQQHITRSILSLVIPAGTYVLYWAFGKVVSVIEARDLRTQRRLAESKKKMVQDLKDSTRFDKTMALIKKYSPEDQAFLNHAARPVPLPIMPAAKQLRQAASTSPSQMLSAAAGAGKALFPVLDHLATNVVGDNNQQLMAHLRHTQAQLAEEQHRNAALLQHINLLQAKYGISSADMSDSRALTAPTDPRSQLTFQVQAEDDEADPSFLTGPLQPRALTYSGEPDSETAANDGSQQQQGSAEERDRGGANDDEVCAEEEGARQDTQEGCEAGGSVEQGEGVKVEEQQQGQGQSSVEPEHSQAGGSKSSNSSEKAASGVRRRKGAESAGGSGKLPKSCAATAHAADSGDAGMQKPH